MRRPLTVQQQIDRLRREQMRRTAELIERQWREYARLAALRKEEA